MVYISTKLNSYLYSSSHPPTHSSSSPLAALLCITCPPPHLISLVFCLFIDQSQYFDLNSLELIGAQYLVARVHNPSRNSRQNSDNLPPAAFSLPAVGFPLLAVAFPPPPAVFSLPAIEFYLPSAALSALLRNGFFIYNSFFYAYSWIFFTCSSISSTNSSILFIYN